MGTTISPQLRTEVASFIRRVVDRALDDIDGSCPEPRASVLKDIHASIYDAVECTLRASLSAHNSVVAVNALPPEILGTIFQYLGRRDRLIASHVCQHWRLTAIGDARLWTDHVVDHVGDRSLQFFRPMLSRTKDVPLLVDITFGERNSSATKVTPTHVTEFSELLYNHLHHIRDLAVHIAVEHAVPEVLSALKSPAPLLKALELAASRSCSGIRLPADLFAGRAPMLESAVLQRVRLPHDEIPAFSPLRTLAITAYEKFIAQELCRVLSSVPQLRKLALGLCDLPRDAMANSESVTRVETFYAEGGISHSDEELIRLLNLFVDLDSAAEVGICSPTTHEMSLILSRCAPCERLSVVSRTGYSFSLRASSTNTPCVTYRLWRLHLHHFSTIIEHPQLFDNLRELTLAEAVWSESLGADRAQLPPAPRLEHFTLVLAVEREYFVDGLSWGGNFGGVFHLGVGRDEAGELLVPPWDCPALRTLRLMSSAEHGAAIAERDVANLLTYHMLAPNIKRLELLHVALHSPTTLLHDFVEEAVSLAEEEFTRVWPKLFPDLEWTGAIGRQDTWLTR